MSFPASTSAVRLSGHRTAKIATAVINANANHRVMEPYYPFAAPTRGRHRRAYITPDHGGNGAISPVRIDRIAGLGARSFTFSSACHFRGLAQQRGILAPKHLRAKAYCSIDLGLSKASVKVAGTPKSLEQCPRPIIEILPEFAQRALRHFVNGKLTGEIPTNSDTPDQCTTPCDVVGIEHGMAANILRTARSQPLPHATRHRFKLSAQQV